ncbi:MAG: AAA family ATPase, partial [Oscillatoriales cyanobacterium SM2_1_8]|nr:AAA family ATPase [Oscillatoriales cyanobacterium SM2_1_8]
MIPQRLVLKDFLSYQALDLDLMGLRAACIWGANGAGKSSLLEAMVWGLWGKSRAGSEDDLIRTGALEAQVRFQFGVGEVTYRVWRTRSRGGGGTLEFQVAVGDRFQSLTGRGLRATQQLIVERLKLDYDTFLNSAYLRQGRADEFMLRRPAERKEILAEILGLNECDRLAEKARDVARRCKGESAALELQQTALQKQQQELGDVPAQIVAAEVEWQEWETVAAADRQRWQELTQQQQLRQQLTQAQEWCRRQLTTLAQTLAQAEHRQRTLSSQMQEWEGVLARSAAIRAAADRHRQQQAAERQHQQQEMHCRQWQERQRELQQQWQARHNERLLARQAIATELQALQSQREELQVLLQKGTEIEAARERAQQTRAELQEYDRRFAQWQPRYRHREQRQRFWEKEEARLRTRLEERQRWLEAPPPENLDGEIERLQKRQVYRDRVREKGLERRDFAQTLEIRQQECETRLARLQSDLERLQQAMEVGESYPPLPPVRSPPQPSQLGSRSPQTPSPHPGRSIGTLVARSTTVDHGLRAGDFAGRIPPFGSGAQTVVRVPGAAGSTPRRPPTAAGTGPRSCRPHRRIGQPVARARSRIGGTGWGIGGPGLRRPYPRPAPQRKRSQPLGGWPGSRTGKSPPPRRQTGRGVAPKTSPIRNPEPRIARSPVCPRIAKGPGRMRSRPGPNCLRPAAHAHLRQACADSAAALLAEQTCDRRAAS